jgi:HlyD family secretion protein
MSMMIRRVVLGLVGAVVVAGAVWAFWPRPLAVETAVIGRQGLDVTVEDEGLSRIRDLYTVSAPISGKLLRLDLKPGDTVTAAQPVATLSPTAPGLLDTRARAIAQSNVSVAQSAVEQAKALRQQAEAQVGFAQSELKRSQSLAGRGIIPEQVYQKAQLGLSIAQSALDAADATLMARQRELESANAALIGGEPLPGVSGGASTIGQDWVVVAAPIAGRVLSLLTTSEQVVAAGTPLLVLGDPANLEVTVDLLSRDAVAVSPGDAAAVEGWGGPSLRAVVERVDPAAVTKISALGIEEQRVAVVLRLVDASPDRQRLGHNFRVVVRIVVWHGENLTVLPLGALFRQREDWDVYVIAGGRARARKVILGHQNADFAEVRSGLAPGEIVILYPSDRISDGSLVTPEQQPVASPDRQ